MNFVIPPASPCTIPVTGIDAVFPVNRVFCVGRNYAAHAREMGHNPDRERPFFFQKNPDCLITCGQFVYPTTSRDVHHEIELAVVLQAGGSDIRPEEALTCVFGYAVALDMTKRDLQAELKKQGRPWEAAKAFANSAPCSAIVRSSEIGHPNTGLITLDVNGARRQTGDLADLIWPVPALIAELSKLFTLHSGDVILTGTPDGVGPVVPGDKLAGHIDGVGELHVTITGSTASA